MLRDALALLAAVASLFVASPARPHAHDQRAEAPAPLATGLIVGQVIDGTTRKPISDAIVDLLPQVAPTSPTSINGAPRLRVITDPAGRYYFSDLPSGRYNLRVNKAGYLVSNGSRRRPIGFTNSYPSPIDLSDGEKVLDWTLPLWKLGIISGTVLDEAGDPAIGVEVRPFRRTFVSGRPRFTIVTSSIVATDDRGSFRMASLPPGDYAIYIPTTMTSFPASTMEDPSGGFLGNREFGSVIREISTLGSPTNQKIGDAVLLTLNRAPRPPAPANGRVGAYLMTFHPAAPGAPPSEFISVPAGEERVVSLQLRLVPAVTVAGTLSGPAGPLARTGVRLVSAALAGSAPEAELETATGVTDDRGRFTLLGVPAGRYVLRVLTPPTRGGTGLTPPSTPDRPVLWASESLAVGDADITDLTIAARPALTVAGRLRFRETGNQPDARAMAGLPVNFDSIAGGPGAAIEIDQNGAFAAGVPGGRYSVRLEAPEGWRLISIEFDGRDASDQPIEITSDATLVFTLTNQRTLLSGTVRDAHGQPDAYGLVGVFPSRRDWWADYPLMAGRMRATQLSAKGEYQFADLPSGEYFVVSVPETIGEEWLSPANLETLSRTAVRVTIADGDARVQDLRAAVR